MILQASTLKCHIRIEGKSCPHLEKVTTFLGQHRSVIDHYLEKRAAQAFRLQLTAHQLNWRNFLIQQKNTSTLKNTTL